MPLHNALHSLRKVGGKNKGGGGASKKEDNLHHFPPLAKTLPKHRR